MSRVESRGTWALLALFATVASAEDSPPLRFDFAKGGNAADHALYDSRGFGFESGQPSRFSARVPEGNHRVVLRFGRTRDRAPLVIRAEQRRLIARLADLDAEIRRGNDTLSFVVNVRRPELPTLPENAAGGTRVALKPREIGSPSWDEKLTLELEPWPAALRSIEITVVDLPTLYLAGDSTVTDQPAPDASWGQYLTRFFDGSVAIANHAESGESLKSFVTELRFDKLLSTLRAGDWVMVQFGHNDQKTQWPQTYVDAATTYRSWLRAYIAEIRRRGATPLLVTSPERRNFDTDGHIRPTLAEYAAAMRTVAAEENVALLDLNALSVRVYEALGPAVSPRAFAANGDDHTHHSEYGAELLARCVVSALRGANRGLTGSLERHLVDDAAFDPADPPLPD